MVICIFLNVPEDKERSKRYNIIWNYLTDNDYLQPKVPDLDENCAIASGKITEMGR